MYFKIKAALLLSCISLVSSIELPIQMEQQQQQKRELDENMHCVSLHADFLRRQAAYFNSTDAFDNSTSADDNKHVPFITLSDDNSQATVVVGDDTVYHPVVPSNDNPDVVHYVTDIYVVDETGSIVYYTKLDPSIAADETDGKATVTFDVPSGVSTLTAYEWCNLHGLWVGPEVTVDADASGADVDCIVTPAEYPEGAYESARADFERRQAAEFGESDPYTEDDGVKHTPYIEYQWNYQALVALTVGSEDSEVHPMTASDDPDTVHFVTDIFVEDQYGNVIFMTALDPSDVDEVFELFTLPTGVTSMTAYEFCNLHGYWKGPTVELSMLEIVLGSTLGPFLSFLYGLLGW
eukprot:CAMPEP_0178957460 /NCGR_PEP_ID=MMETSP0789-20121207/10931_1 /TAXON_ID=3005 /ORGANISM="Rhizosolenia setigera, Strain CCMP 1694" /LENGTH=350 /DNA_ID=CAMNT_0020639721 /DNA_START=55 /DNA_END=1108 /DNA_ORIENTATION=+